MKQGFEKKKKRVCDHDHGISLIAINAVGLFMVRFRKKINLQ
jgi:hypothetical protein